MRQVHLCLLFDGDLYVKDENTFGELLGTWWIGSFSVEEEQQNSPLKVYREYKGIK